MNKRMTFSEAKERIIRLNEGGNLFDCDNSKLRIHHLKIILNALVHTQHQKDFLCGIMHFAGITAHENPIKYKQHRGDYRRLYRTAKRLIAELDTAQPTLF